MNRQEKLLSTLLKNKHDPTEAQMIDTTVRFILNDMGHIYIKFWKNEGPGVMVFQPQSSERSMFYWTLKELHDAKESCERENNGDLAESFRRILEAAAKIKPDEKAGYLINDNEGIRYFEIDYNKAEDGNN
jgi:hypothetical protein